MSAAFNVFGRIVSTLLGMAVVGMGVVWILQAFDIAFNTPIFPGGPVGFMVNNRQWAVYGAIAVLVGLGQIVWSNTGARVPKLVAAQRTRVVDSRIGREPGTQPPVN
jgi:hypothetical protein